MKIFKKYPQKVFKSISPLTEGEVEIMTRNFGRNSFVFKKKSFLKQFLERTFTPVFIFFIM